MKKLLTNNGPIGILWFDGEWESSWNTDRGIEVHNYAHSLQPQIIVNNRVGNARAGMTGLDRGAGVGDYGTPEQQIPPTGFGPGVYWESCMTMNNHWGYNKHDEDRKSPTTLVRNLIACASSFSGTSSFRDYTVKILGWVRLGAGNHTLALRTVAGKWRPMNVRFIKLSPKPV